MGALLLQEKQRTTTIYAVLYRGNAEHPEIEEGVQARECLSPAEADTAVRACKRWFNEEIVIRSIEGKETKETVTHDRVVVWIDKYVNGKLAHSGEPGWKAESSEAAPAPATSSSGKK